MLFGFTTVCSVMRMVQITTIAKNGNSTMLVLWGTIEMNIGITTTCIPTLSPLFKYFADRHLTPKSPSEGYSNSGGNGRMRNIELAFRGHPARGDPSFVGSIDGTSDSEERILSRERSSSAIGMHKDFDVKVSSEASRSQHTPEHV
jgi:hypothetical protein